MRHLLVTIAIATAACVAACGPSEPPRVAQGSPVPDFSLSGADGRAHALQDYAGSRVLAVVFTGNTCPVSQLYEARLRKLYDDYRDKGVVVVAINPNRPGALREADLAYSDVGESLDDMKARAADRRLAYPYLSDGDSQALTRKLKVVSTPHIFIFDQTRTLTYDGRIDDNVREDRVQSHDARNAIDAALAGRPAPITRTAVTGCPIKGLADPADAGGQQAAPDQATVALEMAGPDTLKALRQNGTGRLLLINFWATWCAPCATEFPDLESTYRRYKSRNVDLVTVSVNDPEDRPAVLEFLKTHGATHRNLQFATSDVYALQAAFDPQLPAPVPFTLLLAPGGEVRYQALGEFDVTKLRRAILANLPDDPNYPGLQAYWSTAVQ